MRIGIMQGRLIPPEPERFQAFPRARWRDEFPMAQAAGLQAIEWIYDRHSEDVNPITTREGIASLLALSAQHEVAVVSLCADYFMDIGGLELSKLAWLLECCKTAGISRVVLPFVDASQIQDSALVVTQLWEAIPLAERFSIELHLETSLDPHAFAALLSQLRHPLVKVNYDSGNSASLGYSPAEEFAAYGDRVGSVHIKDRVFHGGTVPLGTGSAQFPSFFQALKKAGYSGDYILQVARETPGDELALARRNLSWLQSHL